MRYVTIQEWMLELHLRPAELITFALIYGFSQDGESWFKGSTDYVCQWTGLSVRGAKYLLKNLIERGLIVKESSSIGSVRHVNYRVSDTYLAKCKNCTLGEEQSANISEQSAKIALSQSAKIAPHNIVSGILVDKEKENKEKEVGESPLPLWPTFEQRRQRHIEKYGY